MKLDVGFILLAGIACCSCSKGVDVTVTNNSDLTAENAMVELVADSVLGRIDSKYCYVTDGDGNEIPSQITYDGKLIFRTSIGKGETASYKVLPSDTLHSYPQLVSGRLYPERADDAAWENEVNGYRAYGPATQAKGERGFGYDIFFKHKTDEQILEKLYGPETDGANWRMIDSVSRIDKALADHLRDSISYHIDHGLGMDCYAVGPTLGAGVAAIMKNDSIYYPWCYEKAEVIQNGPLRYTMRLDFAPVAIAGDSAVIEHRLISLDAGSYLNDTRVWYDGLSGNTAVVMGFPLRDESVPYSDDNIIAYSDPTQGPDNGRALLGLISVKAFERNTGLDNHVLGVLTIQPSDTLAYSWGFAWDREDIKDMESWTTRLNAIKNASLKVEY